MWISFLQFIGNVATIYLYVPFKRLCETPVISWVLVIFTRNFVKNLVFTMIEYLSLILEFFLAVGFEFLTLKPNPG
jgi:hypothetical protein